MFNIPKYRFNLVRKQPLEGVERRKNTALKLFDNALAFPKPIDYEDIDRAFKEWVENKLEIQYEGKSLPTYTLLTNQRIGEYSQSWNKLDKDGNLMINFKTMTRENNPKKGSIYGDNCRNVPGNHDYPIGYRAVRENSRLIGYDKYTMKQPLAVDLNYKVYIVTNKYELLNEMNQKVHDRFKALQDYIYPNDHAMSMILNDVGDESEYNINDRKYYSQSYSITVRAYIIKEDDFKVTHLPIRYNLYFTGVNALGVRKNVCVDKLTPDDSNVYRYIQVKRTLELEASDSPFEFLYDLDNNLYLTDIQLSNIQGFELYVNDEKIDLENEGDTIIYSGDKIKFLYSLENQSDKCEISLIGDDRTELVDSETDKDVTYTNKED